LVFVVLVIFVVVVLLLFVDDVVFPFVVVTLTGVVGAAVEVVELAGRRHCA
jgi:hypothetical protein